MNKSNEKHKNRVDSSISYKRTVINSNSNTSCKTCNKCLISVNHDQCVVRSKMYVKQSSATKVWRVKQVKQVWKATGKLNTPPKVLPIKQWKPTGRLLPLGRQCPLVRSTALKSDCLPADPQETIAPVVQIVLWYLDSGCSKHMTGDRSRLRNFVKKFIGTVRFGNDHFGAIMGYGDYVIGDSVISRVYYVEGLGHNLFSVGQFCDSDLEVAFRKHTCFVRDLDGVDLIKGSRGTNLYTISVEDMMRSSPICLLSKASKNKSWLWHRRLNHLNFGTLNDLARKDLVRGLPRLKFEKDHLCSACQLGKSRKATHKPKTINTIMEVLHTLHMDLCGPMRVFVRTDNGTESWLWHRRLNHLNFGTLNDLARKDLVRGLPRLKFEKDHLCSACQLGKSRKATHKPKTINTITEVLHTLHMDLCGPLRVQSINGKKYILVIVDDYSRFTWVNFLRSKDETPAFVANLLKQLQVGLNKTVWFVRTDNGTEFVNKDLTDFYESVGITHEKTVSRTPQQNGVVERRNRTLVEAARTMLIFSKAPFSGPNPNLLTPGPISLGLVPNSAPTILYVPPTNKDLELLFQPMFDEYFETPTGDHQMTHVPAVPPPVIPTGPSVSIYIFVNDAPLRHSHSPSSVSSSIIFVSTRLQLVLLCSSVVLLQIHVLSKSKPKNLQLLLLMTAGFKPCKMNSMNFDRLGRYDLGFPVVSAQPIIDAIKRILYAVEEDPSIVEKNSANVLNQEKHYELRYLNDVKSTRLKRKKVFIKRMIDLAASATILNPTNPAPTDHADADIRPIYDEEPMAEVQLIADHNVSATGQQHTEQPESNNEGEVDQNDDQCYDTRPLPAKLTDNTTTELSNQLLRSEHYVLQKDVAQFQKDFSRMEAHCVNLELNISNHV
ncbi:retrovirus-related pol polyprotein from transposon TNT 1-94 [Tanacetum coccineum]